MEDTLAISSAGKGKLHKDKVNETILTTRTSEKCVSNRKVDGHSNGKRSTVNGNGNGQLNDLKNGQGNKANGLSTEQQRNGRLAKNGRMHNCNGRRRFRKPWGWADWLMLAFGSCVGVVSGVAYACLLYYLHENRLWFTHIKEVEREISFRTESGLYYSYYKQFLNAPSVSQGLYELVHDNSTESWRTINVLQRFNIYQEVFLGLVYRTVPFIHNHFLPILFYVHSVFALHGIYFTTIFATAWLLSNSWLAGLLACTFFVVNKEDTSRVDFTIPLRESFALPYLYLQLALITYYLRPSTRSLKQTVCLCLIQLFTFLFVLTWQFAQFVLLLQAFALYCGAITGVIPLTKVRNLFNIHLASILAVCVLQFINKMLLGSLVFSFIITALLDFRWQLGRPAVTTISGHVVRLGARLAFTAAGMFILNFTIKLLIGLDADQHIFKFITAKFGLTSARDFDVLLYKCHGAFAFLPIDVLQRLTFTTLFPVYTAVVFGLLSVLIVAVLQNWTEASEMAAKKKDEDRPSTSTATPPSPSPSPSLSPLPHPTGILRRPDLAFHTLQTIPMGLMALVVLRMKFVWVPHMCILAAFGISNASLWRWLLGKLGCKSDTIVQCVRHGTAVVIIAISLYACYPRISSELGTLREFYDPDTVELMNWISQQTPKTAIFSGSMQLLAGVKLCTGRRLTNHPHYEDKELRDKTMQLYQYYGRRSAQDVYDIHVAIGTEYIILEDSICYGRSTEIGCRLPDILDIMNGHLYVDANPGQEPDLRRSNTVRFCDAIKKGSRDFTSLFRLSFQNRTFRVYRLVGPSVDNT